MGAPGGLGASRGLTLLEVLLVVALLAAAALFLMPAVGSLAVPRAEQFVWRVEEMGRQAFLEARAQALEGVLSLEGGEAVLRAGGVVLRRERAPSGAALNPGSGVLVRYDAQGLLREGRSLEVRSGRVVWRLRFLDGGTVVREVAR